MDPISMALVAAGTQAVGSIVQGNAQSAAAKANARIADQNRDIALQQAGAREDQVRRQSLGVLGAQYAGIAESGVDPGSGSAARALAQSATNAEYDALVTRYEGRMQALGFEREASLERARGRNARNAGYLNAATSILAGAAQAYGMRTQAPPGSSTTFGIDNLNDRWGTY